MSILRYRIVQFIGKSRTSMIPALEVLRLKLRDLSEMGQKLSIMVSVLRGANINSFSKVFDPDGNGEFFKLSWATTHGRRKFDTTNLERDGLKLKQAEWNIFQMGTTKYEANCKRIRFKNIHIETADLPVQKSIPLMTDKIINVSSFTKHLG